MIDLIIFSPLEDDAHREDRGAEWRVQGEGLHRPHEEHTVATLHESLASWRKLGPWAATLGLIAAAACSKAQPAADQAVQANPPAAGTSPLPLPAAAPAKAEQAPAKAKESAAPASQAAAADRETEPEAWDPQQAYGATADDDRSAGSKANDNKDAPLKAAGEEARVGGTADPRIEEKKPSEHLEPPAGVASGGRSAGPTGGVGSVAGKLAAAPKAVAKSEAASPEVADKGKEFADAADRAARPTGARQSPEDRGGAQVSIELDNSGDSGAVRRDRPLLIARPQPRDPPPRPRPAVAQVPYRSPDRPLRRLPAPVAVYPKDARYRSTYLPGRGYLQHLQASIQQAAGKGDAGLAMAMPQRTRPSLPQPQGSALKVAIDLSHKQLPAQGGQITVRVRLRGAEQRPTQRVPLRLHLVVDSSGSMKGKPWQQVCAAVELLSQRLLPTDQMSITVFSESAQVLAPPTPGGAPLAALARQVCLLKPRGETNTFAGLQLGYQQARNAYSGDATNRVLLISDGMATVGPREPYEITADTARALGQGITTSGLGIGRDFDSLLMNRIALEGGGNHHFVRDVAALPAVVVDELEVLSQQAAEAVDVRISLPEDVALVEVVGSEPLGAAEALRARQVEVASDQRIARDRGIAANRQRDFDGGVRFLLPAFRAGDEHSFLLVVHVPPGTGQREVARLAVRYKDLVNKKNAGFVGGRVIQYADPGAPALGVSEPDVLLTEARARAGHALQRASEYMDDINLPAIRSELYSAAMQLQKAADATGSALAQAESARVQALADGATDAMRRRQGPWLAAVLHYQWRVCGLTAWAE